jgi:DNA-binding beta-propeller fold protein YncE
VKRLILLVGFGLLTGGIAAAQTPNLFKVSLPGKNFEGMAVNPVTHKAYVMGELATEGADDVNAVFVVDNRVLTGRKPAKVIVIPNENEYIAIDSNRNLIYVPTRFQAEGDDSDDPGEDSERANAPVPMKLGTLTVINGNTDTVIATWYFSPGIEPEAVAVDPDTGIVYVAAKAPEGEAADDGTCSSGIPIPDPGEPGDIECWTPGFVFAFYVIVDPLGASTIRYLKTIPAGDDPESVVFENGMVYAANEDDGTVTIASAVRFDGSGGELLTDLPVPPTQPYELGIAPYSLGVFYEYGPNPLACVENKFEADKMAAGGGSVFLTDDRSRVAKITGIAAVAMQEVPGATVCENIPNSDGGGLNTANNIAFMQRYDREYLYVVSEQNTVALYNATTMTLKATITVPGAQHLDAIGVDGPTNRVWVTDEALHAVFVLKGVCASGRQACIPNY